MKTNQLFPDHCTLPFERRAGSTPREVRQVSELHVGLYVHSRESVYVIQNTDGEVVGQGSVPPDVSGLASLRDQHSLPDGTTVAMESGTGAFFVARELTRLGLDPVVIDAFEVRAKASRPRQKSDRRDALELCEGIRRDIYRSRVYVPSSTIISLRRTLARRRHFVRLLTSQVNAVKRMLRGAGLAAISRRSLKTDKAWQSLLNDLSDEDELELDAAHHHALWLCADQQVRALDKRLREFSVQFRSQMKILQTVPGVGPIVSLTTIAVFGDVARFPSAKAAASYAGLVPSTYQSGDTNRHGRITKRGSGELRAMLCEAAHHARRASHPLNPHFARLCARRGYKMATVAVAHRLCRILYAMLRDGSEFNPQILGLEEGPFTKKITRQYRLTPRRT